MRLFETGVMLLYFAGAVSLAVWLSRRGRQGADAFWSANRTIGIPINSLAQFSSLLSSASFLGFLGMAHRFGWIYTSVVFGIGSALGFLLSLLLVSGPLRQFCEEHNKFTLSSYFEARFGPGVAALSSFIVIVVFSLFLVPQLMGAGLAGSFILGVDYSVAVILTAICILTYVLIGGMVSVTWMDFMNAVMMFVFMVVLSAVAIAHFGGVGELAAGAKASNPRFLQWNPAMSAWSCVGLAVAIIGAILCSPHIVMRIYSARSIREGRKALALSGALSLFFHIFGYFGVAGAALILHPDLENIDRTYIVVMDSLLPAVLRGLAVAAIFAAILSTADAVLLALGAEFSQNVFRRFLRPAASPQRTIRAGRVMMLLVGIVVTMLALRQTANIGIVMGLVVGGVASAFVVPLLAGIWWTGASSSGALWSMGGGLTTYVGAMVLWRGQIPIFSEILLALPLAGIALLGGTWFDRRRAEREGVCPV